MEKNLEQWVDLAKQGNQTAIETVLVAIQDRVYGLARRMLWHPADAEDASQEILLKVLTHLSTFQHESSFLTWVYHIACNHLLTMRKQRAEAKVQTFEDFDRMLEENQGADGLQVDERGEDWLLVEEIKIGCTMGLLLCLDRDERVAFILGEIFEVSGPEAALILSVPAATFRKRLSRARQRVYAFVQERCGLVNPAAACRCARVAATQKARRSKAFTERLVFAGPLLAQRTHPQIVAGMQELTTLDRKAALFRSHPDFQAPRALVEEVRKLLGSGQFQLLAAERRRLVEHKEGTR
jgi:RNA polymerase sigma factor (sigma-70 family)